MMTLLSYNKIIVIGTGPVVYMQVLDLDQAHLATIYLKPEQARVIAEYLTRYATMSEKNHQNEASMVPHTILGLRLRTID